MMIWVKVLCLQAKIAIIWEIVALLFIIMIIAYLPFDVNFLNPKSDDLALQGNKISLSLLGYCAYLRCLLTLQNPAERLLKLLVAKIKCNVFRQ